MLRMRRRRRKMVRPIIEPIFVLEFRFCQKVWEGADWISGTTELGAKLEGCEGESAGAEVESRLDGEGVCSEFCW
jgi:hypothetical protein